MGVQGGPPPLRHHHPLHVVDGGVCGHHVEVGQLELLEGVVEVSSATHLPEHEPKGVHISSFEALKLTHVDSVIQNLKKSNDYMTINNSCQAQKNMFMLLLVQKPVVFCMLTL